MGTLVKFAITGVVSAVGGAMAYRKAKIGGSYVKFWKGEFWTGKPKTDTTKSK